VSLWVLICFWWVFIGRLKGERNKAEIGKMRHLIGSVGLTKILRTYEALGVT
jgi:hypothetical protein